MNESANPRKRLLDRRPSRRALYGIGAVLAALVLLLVLFDWNWFKRPIERLVEARTGRPLSIGGDLDVDLGSVTTVKAEKLRFGNATWSKEPTMAAADRAEIDFELWPLIFKRQTRIPEIRLTAPDVRLETDPKGVGN